MGSWYIPQAEAIFDDWARNFAALIAADPAVYGVSAPDAAALAAACNAWEAAFAAATAPSTRTRPAVAAKNAAKQALLAIIRRLAAAVRINPGVGSELKVNLGLRVPAPGAGPSSIPAPEALPHLSVVGIDARAHTLRVFMEGTAGRARPRGATGVLVFRVVADEAETRPTRAEFLCLATRPTFTSGFSAADRGKVATYFGRWTNAKGELGPWSAAAAAPIAA